MKKKIFSILFALVLVLSFSLVTAVLVVANPEPTLTIGDISAVPPPPPAPAAFTVSSLLIIPTEVDIGETVKIAIVVTNTVTRR